jgi:hypothetical protein
MEEISWIDRVKNKALHRVREGRNIVHAIKCWKANWVGHGLRKNYFIKRVIEGYIARRIEVTGRRERRGKQLVDGLKERRGW